MILIIRNIKSNDLLFLAFVCVFYKRKDKAAIRSIIFAVIFFIHDRSAFAPLPYVL